jgi:hypothetical protein
MDRAQLAHILRAACDVTGDPDVIVLGSQSILGTYDEDELPAAATASMEADLAWADDGPDRERADKVNGEIGELSGFHQANGYYPEGISLATATLPLGWQERVHGWPLASSHPANARFLDKHDLVVSKLAAFRDKDRAFVAALLHAGLVDPDTVRQRAALLPDATAPLVSERILSWLDAVTST